MVKFSRLCRTFEAIQRTFLQGWRRLSGAAKTFPTAEQQVQPSLSRHDLSTFQCNHPRAFGLTSFTVCESLSRATMGKGSDGNHASFGARTLRDTRRDLALTAGS